MFLPFPVDVELGREVTFSVILILGIIARLLTILRDGKIEFINSPALFIGLLVVVLFFGLSTVFSNVPTVSLLLSDAVAERFSTLIFAVLAFLLVISTLKLRETKVFLLVLTFSGILSGIITAASILSGVSLLGKILPFAQGPGFNAIGTINALSLLYASLASVILGLLFSFDISWRKWVRVVLGLGFAVFVLNIIVVNFRTSWILLLGASIFLLGLLFKKRFEDRSVGLNWRLWLILAVLAASTVMIFVRDQILSKAVLPAEVSPSLNATLAVAGSVFKEGPKAVLLGTGPGTFGLNWQKYKDPAINQTIFWAVRFNQGFSYVATLVSTTGLAGFLAYIGFLLLSLFIFLRSLILYTGEEGGMKISIFLGYVALLLSIFLYPGNYTLLLLLFILMGLLVVLGKGEGSGIWKNRGEEFIFRGPWEVFLSSLAAVVLISLGVTALYSNVGRMRAVFLQQSAVAEFQRGDTEKAIQKLERASNADEKNYRYYNALTQVRTEKIRGLVARASQGQNVQEEFQKEVSLAIQSSQTAIQLFPKEPMLWRVQGALYELVVPFIQGSERLALQSYRKAVELDPVNPSAWLDIGRTDLVFADKVRLFLGQASQSERAELEKILGETLKESISALQKTIELKPDLATAHFLMTQAALRAGNVEAAILSAENAKVSAPFDIGVAFQLGLLYYQAGNFSRAETEFLRAVSINSNYSNARYFLGLIYDRQKESGKAIKEFEKVFVLNPGNEEVKKILANLRSAKPALTGIVSPNQRQEAPVR